MTNTASAQPAPSAPEAEPLEGPNSTEGPDSDHPSERGSGFGAGFEALCQNMALVLRGKRPQIELSVLTLLAGGHLLIEDVPGVGKTLLAKALAASIEGSAKRVQFTPDLLPGDVIGVTIYERKTGEFRFRQGAIFANVVLCDEINRASPKTQSALLEAMEERQATVDGVSHPLPDPCMVLATQNPIEHEGTYPLPESQLDRFLVRTSLGYPSRADELSILDTHGDDRAMRELRSVLSIDEVVKMIALAQDVYVAPALKGYLVDVVDATRRHNDVRLGASPRASLGLLRMVRARAASQGREFVVPDDVQALAEPVLAHRILLHTERQADHQADLVAEALASVPVPTRRS